MLFLETFSPVYKQAYDFLIAISEPVSRPQLVHEYKLTPSSLKAAASVNISTRDVISVLDKLSKVKITEKFKEFIREATRNYGKAKLVLNQNKCVNFKPSSASPRTMAWMWKFRIAAISASW